jgi:superfamily II DNA/RNA helicase
MVCQSKTKKMATLRNIVKKLASPTNKVLVFFDSSRPLEVIGKKVAGVFENGIVYEERKTELDDIGAKPVVSILRYEDSLSQRAGATKAFTEGSDFRVMVTTDLAARGLDMVGVSHIVHFDLPSDADTYLHRSGRAGRLGNKGQVITILTNDQEFVLNRLTNELGIDAKCVGRQKEKKASSR